MRISDWSSDVCSSDLLDDREHRLGRIGEHAALDPLQQPVGLIAGKIRLEAQAARAGLLAQRLGLVALGIVVGESRDLVLVHIAPFRRWISGPFKRLHRIDRKCPRLNSSNSYASRMP